MKPSKLYHPAPDATIKALDKIREGRLVSVAFTQERGLTVAVVTGKWHPRDDATLVGWTVRSAMGHNAAFILPTDKIALFRQAGKIHLRVDLQGRRIPHNRAVVGRAIAAGIITESDLIAKFNRQTSRPGQSEQ